MAGEGPANHEANETKTTQSLEEQDEEGRRQSSVKRKGAAKWEDERDVVSEEEKNTWWSRRGPEVKLRAAFNALLFVLFVFIRGHNSPVRLSHSFIITQHLLIYLLHSSHTAAESLKLVSAVAPRRWQ